MRMLLAYICHVCVRVQSHLDDILHATLPLHMTVVFFGILHDIISLLHVTTVSAAMFLRATAEHGSSHWYIVGLRGHDVLLVAAQIIGTTVEIIAAGCSNVICLQITVDLPLHHTLIVILLYDTSISASSAIQIHAHITCYLSGIIAGLLIVVVGPSAYLKATALS